MAIEFTKMSGAGNDFIVIDNRDGKLPEAGRHERFARWCQRRTSVGADGVLLVEPPTPGDDGAHFRMRYYNADGGEAESCGNGARCISRFAHLIGAAPAALKFQTKAGLYEAEVGAGDVVLSMSPPHGLRRDINLVVPGLLTGRVDFVNTGVPHVVLVLDDLEGAPVFELGRAIRHHAEFAPAGTNVNFIKLRQDGGIDIRTYERGVEDETLACGTGSVAAALIARLHSRATSPVAVHTRGGVVLKIHFEFNGSAAHPEFSSIKLEGEARVVYRGTIED